MNIARNDPLLLWGFAAVAAGSLAALAAPLAAYVFLTALFGLPHVLCEMRYCDERFSARIPPPTLAAIGALLAALAAERIGLALHVIDFSWAMVAELSLGAALAFLAASVMRAHRMVGALAGLALVAGVAVAPLATFLIVAWLHNLTPLAFAWENSPVRERARRVLLLAAPFFLWPAFIATGWPQAVLDAAFGHDATAAPSLFGAERRPIYGFLPRGLDFAFALPLFSAAVAATAMHYFAVIVVLPRLLQTSGAERRESLVPWPSWRTFYAAVALAGLATLAIHAADYSFARRFYGVAAALHSWVELPILLMALGAVSRTRPAARPVPTMSR